MYNIEDLVKVAKRENNSTRSYLYVNPLQGKHIPVKPYFVKNMCGKLSKMLNERYIGDKLYVIGFSETATAIGTYVASNLNSVVCYENTTREIDSFVDDYVYFTESHSHAKEQKLNVANIKPVLEMTDRIIFVEDEVTTGNTICKLIDEIKKFYNDKNIKFTIASVLNSMSNARLAELEVNGIDCVYIKKIPYEYKSKELNAAYLNDINYGTTYDYTNEKCKDIIEINQYQWTSNLRKPSNIEDYKYRLHGFCEFVYKNEIKEARYDSLLVIGTEEFMHPAIEVADYLMEWKVASNVKTHSTTRSPIMVYRDENYPLNKRYQIRSMYENERVTYIYNLEKYDKVIIVTDSKLESKKGLENLICALNNEENDNISVYQWGY